LERFWKKTFQILLLKIFWKATFKKFLKAKLEKVLLISQNFYSLFLPSLMAKHKKTFLEEFVASVLANID
jgi:hypothetical protein